MASILDSNLGYFLLFVYEIRQHIDTENNCRPTEWKVCRGALNNNVTAFKFGMCGKMVLLVIAKFHK